MVLNKKSLTEQADAAAVIADNLDRAAAGVVGDRWQAGMLRAMASAYRTFAAELRNLVA